MKYLVPAYLSKNTWNNISVVTDSPIQIGSGANNLGNVKIRVLDKNFDLVDGELTLSPGAATVLRLPIEPGEIAIIRGQAVNTAARVNGRQDGTAPHPSIY
jgi:hypothetical protein